MRPNRSLIDRQTVGQSQVTIWILINQEPYFLNNLINISQTQNIYQIDQKQFMVPDLSKSLFSLDFDHRFDGQSDFGSVS